MSRPADKMPCRITDEKGFDPEDSIFPTMPSDDNGEDAAYEEKKQREIDDE